MIKNIHESIKLLESKYQTNELAYLSLTGKNESFIRDYLSHYLYTLDNLWYREFKRIDIAKISNENPNIITDMIEITSLYTSDILNENHFKKNYLNKILNDFNKNKKHVSEYTNIYILIIATHLKNEFKNEHTKLLKYINGINNGLSKYLKSEKAYNNELRTELIKDCQNMMDSYFNNNQFTHFHDYIDAGEAFGIGVELHYWILQKKKSDY